MDDLKNILEWVGAILSILGIGGIYQFVQYIRKRQKSNAHPPHLLLKFGGGQLHIGKPEFAIKNNSANTYFDLRLSLKIENRLRRWRFWQRKWLSYEPLQKRQWDNLNSHKIVYLVLELSKLEAFLVQKKLVAWEYDEPKPAFASILHPTPIRFHVKLEYYTEESGRRITDEYVLAPECQFAENLLDKTYWKLKQLK